MPRIKCIAFDCFGTVFDMTGVPDVEIRAYVRHVKAEDFSPFTFPQSWYDLKPHADSAQGIKKLQSMGLQCVPLSNGNANLISDISESAGIWWDYIIDLVGHGVYKPKIEAYRTVEKDLGFKPSETMMVTANPTFGDIEGSASIGMQSQVIRQPGFPRDIIDLADILAGYSHA
jgi:2-haloalkanoic acid dehalogenase type II